jgi:hypothetical protein
MLVCPHWRAAMDDVFEAALERQPPVVFRGFEPEFYKKLPKYYDPHGYEHQHCTVVAAKDAAQTDQACKEELLNLAALLSPRTYSVCLEGSDDQVGGQLQCMLVQQPVCNGVV